MRDEGLIGSWTWGPGPSESCRIALTWDKKLGVWSKGHKGESIFGVLQESTGPWLTTELLFDGSRSGYTMKFRLDSAGEMTWSLKYPNAVSTPHKNAKRALEKPAAALAPLPLEKAKAAEEVAPPVDLSPIAAGGKVELELDMVRVGKLSVRAWHRPSGAARAPVAVVICPGVAFPMHPNFSSNSRLMMELEMALVETHVPLAIFDYQGVGGSSTPVNGSRGNPSRWVPPTYFDAVRDTETVLGWAKEHLSDEVILMGFSWGSACALTLALYEKACGFVSISTGCNLPWLYGPDAHALLKWTITNHSDLACKALYILGDADGLTPRDEVQRFTKARKDKGKGAQVEVLRTSAHDLVGHEEEVGALCADFVLAIEAERRAAQ